MTTPLRSVVLLSGGLDSGTCLAWARKRGDVITALSFDYGQRHRVELEKARLLAQAFAAERHWVLPLPLALLGGSALTDPQLAVPKQALGAEAIPITYVPARNLVFLSVAAAVAEVSGSTRIVIGANAVDYSGYPDCRPDFLAAFLAAARLGTKAGSEGRELEIDAPLIRLSKAEIIRLGDSLGLDFSLTSSCYDPLPDGRPCRSCDSCLLRARGFAAAGISEK